MSIQINGKKYKVKYSQTSKTACEYITDYMTVYYKEKDDTEWTLLKSMATKDFKIMEISYDEQFVREYDTDLKDTPQNRAFLCKQTIKSACEADEIDL